MSEDAQVTKKKNVWDTPLLSTKIKTTKAKFWPEGVLGYFLGPILAILSNSVMNSYLNKYYTDLLGLTEWASLFSILLPVLSVILVVAGNILVGKVMDHCKAKAGKARPLLLIAIPLIFIALIFNFYMPSSLYTSNSVGELVWIAVGYNLYYAVAYPFYYTSHSALVNLSTRNSSDRSILSTLSNATSICCTGLVSMILPFLITMFLFVPDPTTGEIMQETSINGWRIFMLVLAILTAVGIVLEYYFTRERITEEQFVLRENIEIKETAEGKTSVKQESKTVSTAMQWKAVRGDKYWWIIIVFYFLYQLGGLLKNNSQMYFAQAFFGYETGSDYSGTISIVGAIPTVIGMLIVWPISNKLGKAKTILYGSILAVVGACIGFIAPDNIGCVLAAFVIKSLGTAPAMYISLALMGDVLDHSEAKYGYRSDGLTMTIYGSIMIGMSGLVNGIINGCLSATGYSTENFDAWIATTDANAYKYTMEALFFGGEGVCYLIIAILMIFMNVEKFSDQDHQVILERQKQECLEQGIPWIEPEERARLEQEEADRKNEDERIALLKKKCAKKNLDFDTEEAKYQAQLAEKKRIAEEKKAAKDAKKKAKEEAKAAKKGQPIDTSDYDDLDDEGDDSSDDSGTSAE